MNRKTEILIGSLVVAVILVFLGIKIFGVSFDRDMVLQKIDEAIEKKDVKYLKDHIEVRGENKELSEKVIEEIVEELEDISVYSLSEYKDDSDTNIYIKKKGKENIIFDKYTIVLKPYDLTISQNIEGTKVFIDDNEVGKFKNDKDFVYKNLMPGKHIVKIAYKDEYVNIEKEEEIMAFNMDNGNEIYLSLELEGRYITVESNIEEATLYIDGKDTEINIYNEYRFGPIDEKKKMNISAKAKIDGKEYESEKINVGDTDYNHFELYIDYEEPMSRQELLREVDNLIDGYETGLVNAINYNSYSYLDGYIEYGSPFMKAQKKLISNLYEKGTTEDLLSYNITDVTSVSDNILSVTVEESHMIYFEGETKKEVNNKWNYTVVNIDDELFIRDIKAAK
ncbi:TcaA NTF2-like domain-containing protein [Tissierella creatinophila]|uniref:PEGA domain protein n=1 Tax=Tissierella creatinophila DSM 6911 TaxID=1123403 RepID=A0A1U7M5Q5_TISCR|nr:hypothetical protein [Tissierella creatinophila]OLS02615.1 hypothetical protein TICRE_14160 [Tissierella creatinophila DSM 6911]